MKIAARVSLGSLERSLARLQHASGEAALDAAADRLAVELAHARERDGLHAPLARAAAPGGRSIIAGDSESIARELGTPTEPPAPWLAPVLPAARAPMRAAASDAVARALSRSRS